MFPFVSRIVLLALLISLPRVSSGQEDAPFAAWLLPGTSLYPAKEVRLLGQLGYNHYFRMGIFYPQGFITVHKNIVLNPAYIYAIQKNKSNATVQEHYLMNAIIFQAGKNNFSIDDRNMLWNRFTLGGKPRHYYRNRLRVTKCFKAWSTTTRLYGYSEVFFLFHFKNPARNRAAFGISGSFTTIKRLIYILLRNKIRGRPVRLMKDHSNVILFLFYSTLQVTIYNNLQSLHFNLPS